MPVHFQNRYNDTLVLVPRETKCSAKATVRKLIFIYFQDVVFQGVKKGGVISILAFNFFKSMELGLDKFF